MNKLLTSLAQLFPEPDIPHVDAGPSLIVTISQFVFGALGAISVLVITIAGLQYVLTQGDPQRIVKAKNTIIYAVVGLIISISGFAIVTFVISNI